MKKKLSIRNMLLMLIPILVALGALAVFSILPKDDRSFLEGSVEISSSTCFAQANGTVKSMLVQTGQPVQQGDVLAVLDDSGIDKQIAQLQQTLKIKRAQLAQLKTPQDAAARQASRRAAQDTVALWQETLAQAKRVQAAAEETLANQKILYEAGVIAEAEWKQYQQAAELAQSQVITTEAQLNAARNNVDAIALPNADQDAISAAQADLELTQLQIDQLEDSRKDYRICAVTDGVVISTSLEAGATVVAGQSVFQLSNGAEQYAVFYVPQEYLGQIAFGDELPLFQQGNQKEIARGTITYIDWKAVYPPDDYENDSNRNQRSVKIKLALHDGSTFAVGQTLFLRLQSVQD